MTVSSLDAALRAILESAISKRATPARLDDSTPLLGSIPELDSMAVLGILTQLQEELGCEIADDEISADIFMTYGDLRKFVEAKLA